MKWEITDNDTHNSTAYTAAFETSYTYTQYTRTLHSHTKSQTQMVGWASVHLVITTFATYLDQVNHGQHDSQAVPDYVQATCGQYQKWANVWLD